MTTAISEEERMEDVAIEDEMKSSYLAYAMSVIVSRALPDVRDGLKPVQRRILYAMHDMGIRAGSQHRKSARIVGEVLGKFHPHGDNSVYDALVRMAQPFSMRATLVDGQGNFGSIDGDPAAAMRYTEARLTRTAEEMLEDIAEDTVDFRPNFDDSNDEPTVLPGRLPNLLVNGATGIAVGMATNMPPHNVAEICDAVCLMIDQPDCDVTDLMRVVPGPDFPTRAVIRGREGIRSMYANGRGKIIIEAVNEIREGRNGRNRIVVTELPYQVNKANLVEKIAGLVRDKTITGVTDIRDESDRRGIRIVLELSRGAQPQVILNNLYHRTALRTSFNAIMLALVDGQPQELPLKSLLEHFIRHRAEVIRRRSEYRLRRAQERAHIVEGLLTALDEIDAVIDTIRNSADVETARNNLASEYGLSAEQAQAILDMQLRRLAAMERQRLEAELTNLQVSIAGLETLLADEELIHAEIRRETAELREKYAEERRTIIHSEGPEQQSEEDFVVQEDVVVTLSQRGYIKRLPVNTYQTHRRGSKGVRGTDNREGDAVRQMEVVSTHDQLICFTNLGRAYALDVHRTPSDASRTSRGTLLVNLINLQDGEHVQTMLPVRRGRSDQSYVIATRWGRIKRMESTELSRIPPKGIRAISLRDDDEIVSVREAGPDVEIIIITARGQASSFSASNVRPQKRDAGGMAGIKLRDGDRVAAMDIVADPQNEILLMASQGGYAKVTPLMNRRGERLYPLLKRATLGVQCFDVETNPKSRHQTGPVIDAMVISAKALDEPENYDVFIISEQGQVVRVNLSEVRIINTRRTRGVIVWRERKENDTVASIACLHDQTGGDHRPEKDGTGAQEYSRVLREAEATAQAAERGLDAADAADRANGTPKEGDQGSLF